MRWFKHYNDLLRSQNSQYLLDKHGTNGIYAFIRLIEILAEHFDPETPEAFVESKRDLFNNLFPTCSNKTGKRILNSLQSMSLFKFKFLGKEVLIGTKFILELADEYTRKVLKEKKHKFNGISSTTKNLFGHELDTNRANSC